MKKAFKKLKRAELVDVIYELRKDNLALEERNNALRQRLEEIESLLDAYKTTPSDTALDKIGGMLLALCDACNVPEEKRRGFGFEPEDRT